MVFQRLKLWLEGTAAAVSNPAGRSAGPRLRTWPDRRAPMDGEPRFDHSRWDGVLKDHVRSGEIAGVVLNTVEDVNRMSKCCSIWAAETSGTSTRRRKPYYT